MSRTRGVHGEEPDKTVVGHKLLRELFFSKKRKLGEDIMCLNIIRGLLCNGSRVWG